MNVNNPYQVWTSQNSSAPSVFGALPYSNAPSPQTTLTFTFTSFNPDILTCTVLGPNNQPFFYINSNQGTTLFQTAADGQTVAFVEWQQLPVLEIRGIVSRTTAQQWIGLSQNRSHRSMRARGRWYTWSPRDNLLCLYATETNPPERLASVRRHRGSFTLEITPSAVQTGLLEVCVVAVALLQCGRNID
ncbi:hypothetical protein C8J56DRAFT_788723 [Mycena floridula]|nr:hypothetical protein C8J56DRAFT_788723 [Mycena floridula]